MAATGSSTFIPTPGLDTILAHSAQMAKSMQQVGENIASVAKVKVPKDTHATENSIEGGAAQQGTGWVAYASAGTPYAPYIEYGTEDTPTVPFMRQALDAAVHGGGTGSVTGNV